MRLGSHEAQNAANHQKDQGNAATDHAGKHGKPRLSRQMAQIVINCTGIECPRLSSDRRPPKNHVRLQLAQVDSRHSGDRLYPGRPLLLH